MTKINLLTGSEIVIGAKVFDESSVDTGTRYPWKGAWSAGVYAVNDCVEHNGSGYVCVQITTTEEPGVATAFWELLVEKGATGATGATGSPSPFMIEVSTTNVDGTATGATTLYTVPTGKTFTPFYVSFKLTAFTVGTKSEKIVASLGTNSTDYDNWMAGNDLGSLTQNLNDMFVITRVYQISDAIKNTGQMVATDNFKLNITTASDATAETWSVKVYGQLEDI